jgi:hypothetical protein
VLLPHPSFEHEEIPEIERRASGPLRESQFPSHRFRFDVAMFCQQAARQEPLGAGVPAPHQPFLHRNVKAALGSGRDTLSDAPSCNLPQHRLEPTAVHPDLVGQR